MRLSKWQALGNDYLLVERAELVEPLTPERVRQLCDYHYGVGSDGVLEVVSHHGAVAHVQIWNPDGSIAELSGNGVRIVAAWLARVSGKRRVSVHVDSREVQAVVRDDGNIELELGRVDVGETERLDVDGEQLEFTPVSIGNPHAVVRHEPERNDVRRLGPLIERHPRFAERTNVQFIRVDGKHDLAVGVWERGAGETLASGTSSVAAAAAAIAAGWCESPVNVHLAGGDLLVEIDAAGNARLTGPAVEIGRIELV
jgi:diaminopimelate epimerase